MSGICWEIKGGNKAENAGDQLISDWLNETDTERINATAEIGVLVTKRPGYGTARVASWWAHMEIATAGRLMDVWKPVPFEVYTAPVRMHLSAAVTLLRHAGYGSPLS